MNKMLVAVFAAGDEAYEGLSALRDLLHPDGDISLYASAVVAKDADGTVRLKEWEIDLPAAIGAAQRLIAPAGAPDAVILYILDVLAGKPAVPCDRPQRPIESLTECELRVLRYLPTNLSAPEISDELHLSLNTVKTHMRHIYEKLGVHARVTAVDRARAAGLLAASRRPASTITRMGDAPSAVLVQS